MELMQTLSELVRSLSLSSQLLNPTACHCISQQSACETVYTFHPHCASTRTVRQRWAAC